MKSGIWRCTPVLLCTPVVVMIGLRDVVGLGVS